MTYFEQAANSQGKRFGRLTIIGPPFRNPGVSAPFVPTQCDCGKLHSVRFRSLVIGETTSCGCYLSEKTRQRATSHGMSATHKKLYKVWAFMKQRCDDRNCLAYKWYGARGITYCERWKDFANFIMDMSPLPTTAGMSLDRIDVNGNYCKDNCRWTGKYEQARNRRDTVYFDIHGVKTCLMDLVDTTGLTRNEIKQKFAQQIWSQ